jgi:hypothetical protein
MGLNEDHEPTSVEKWILAAFKYEHQHTGERRMTPKLIKRRWNDDMPDDDTPGMSKQNINNGLNRLTAAGWVERVEDGLYEFVDDPRDDIVRRPQLENYVVAVASDAVNYGPDTERGEMVDVIYESAVRSESEACERAVGRLARRLGVDAGDVAVVQVHEVDDFPTDLELREYRDEAVHELAKDPHEVADDE